MSIIEKIPGIPKKAEEFSRHHDFIENEKLYSQLFPNGISGVGKIENLDKLIFDRRNINAKFQRNIEHMEELFRVVKTSIENK